ncbi:MAG: hypothetical protein OEZ25_04230 [Candidatus Bathyarchaeota archaeon]|nr:hypothetical protein [Candidatus Bathyarchaeota archaeon]
MKATRRRKKKINRQMVGVLVFLGAFIFVVVASFLTQPKQGRKTAEEYFAVTGIITEGDIDDNNGLLLYGLNLNITAIGGDAHEVWVNSANVGQAYSYEIPFMAEGATYYAYIDFTNTGAGYYYIRLKEGKYPFELPITSLEAVGIINTDVPPPH